jgi:hypothetical protein
MGKKTAKTDAIAEFGDFQTPPPLAAAACMLLKRLGVNPRSVVEPTCGVGNFLSAAAVSFPDLARCVGVEINPEYIAMAGEKLAGLFPPDRIDLNCASFFSVNWTELLKTLPEPILLVGNPPWVTNSDLGVLGSVNLPVKKNFQNHNAFDAVTGKSNFDISEWMLIHLLERMQNRDAVLAMLCKTAVARKVLTHAWKTEMGLQRCSMFLIDAAGCFDAAVDACLLFCSSGSTRLNSDCEVFSGFDERNLPGYLVFETGRLLPTSAPTAGGIICREPNTIGGDRALSTIVLR